MSAPSNEREEIEALLPWYATGQLDLALQQRVERYMREHPEVAGQLALVREESEATVADAERLGVPCRASFDRLMSEVARRSATRAGVLPSVTALLERFADWIGGFSRVQVGALAAAAALLLAVQAAGLVYLVTGHPGGQTYQTASGPDGGEPGRGTFALVSFKPGATSAEIVAALSQTDAQIVDGPRAGGLWRVRLAAEPLPPAEAEARLGALRSKNAVVGFASLTD